MELHAYVQWLTAHACNDMMHALIRKGVARMSENPKARGGHARAQAMSKEERQESARRAALARWSVDLPQAMYEGLVQIGDTEIYAAVLEKGKRLLSQATFLRALGRSRSPKAGTGILST